LKILIEKTGSQPTWVFNRAWLRLSVWITKMNGSHHHDTDYSYNINPYSSVVSHSCWSYLSRSFGEWSVLRPGIFYGSRTSTALFFVIWQRSRHVFVKCFIDKSFPESSKAPHTVLLNYIL
jgi:hypothetical protein